VITPSVVARLGKRRAQRVVKDHRKQAVHEYGSWEALEDALKAGEEYVASFEHEGERYVLITADPRPENIVATVFELLDEVRSGYIRDAVAAGEEHLPEEVPGDWPVSLSPRAQERLPAPLVEEWVAEHRRAALREFGGPKEMTRAMSNGSSSAVTLHEHGGARYVLVTEYRAGGQVSALQKQSMGKVAGVLQAEDEVTRKDILDFIAAAREQESSR
jgi:hypothetical protein